jgi:hypothetical protein
LAPASVPPVNADIFWANDASADDGLLFFTHAIAGVLHPGSVFGSTLCHQQQSERAQQDCDQTLAENPIGDLSSSVGPRPNLSGQSGQGLDTHRLASFAEPLQRHKQCQRAAFNGVVASSESERCVVLASIVVLL